MLAFPDHYAPNLATWIDCLAELPVADDGGTAIVIRHYDRFVAREPQLAQNILDSIESTSRRFLSRALRIDRCGLARARDDR